jgi:hypothetical protein
MPVVIMLLLNNLKPTAFNQNRTWHGLCLVMLHEINTYSSFDSYGRLAADGGKCGNGQYGYSLSGELFL